MSRFLMQGFPGDELAFEQAVQKCPNLSGQRLSAIKTAQATAILVIVFGMAAYFTRLIMFGACMLLCFVVTALAYRVVWVCNKSLYEVYLVLRVDLEERGRVNAKK